MSQGASQFGRKSAFTLLSGYDESRFMGEDVDFYWRLQKLCVGIGGYLEFLDDLKVIASPRRFDQKPLWRTLIWTNPLFIAVSQTPFDVERVVSQTTALAQPGRTPDTCYKTLRASPELSA
jgi:hypothetical protein